MEIAATAGASGATPAERVKLEVGEIAVQLAATLAGDLLYAAPDEPQAIAVALALQAAVPEALVVFCPASDALPGDDTPASPANVGRRVSAFREIRKALGEKERGPIGCITTGEALGRLYPPPVAFDVAPPAVGVGEPVDLAGLFEQLQELGYIEDERVDEPGEVALRGQVLDVYPADAATPLRIEAADGITTAIRLYDPADQRTIDSCDRRELGRVTEPALDGKGVTLLDHLPGARIILPDAAEDRRRRFLALARDAGQRRPKRAMRDIAEEATWKRALGERTVVTLDRQGDPPPRFAEAKRPLKEFAKVAAKALETGDRLVLLGSERDLRFLTRRVEGVLKSASRRVASWREVVAADKATLLTLVMPVDRGFARDGVLAVAAADLLGSRAERGDTAGGAPQTAVFAFGEIRVGDVVVHEDHGIAIVAGLQPMPAVDGNPGGDAIALTYADGGVRLVPVAEADRIWRYGAEADAVTLDKLDGGSWEKRRVAIDAAIAESARALTALAAERAERTARVLDPPADAYERFAAGFPFSETADQARAIAAVRADLASGKPMDRLVIEVAGGA